MCRCKKGYIEYWYDDFDKMSAKDKLSWLKFEYEEEYKMLSQQEKRDFIKFGYVVCPICEGEGIQEDDGMTKADEFYDAMQDRLASESCQ